MSWETSWREPFDGPRTWDEQAYQDLRKEIENLPKGDLRDRALINIIRLDCSSTDKTLASCNPSTEAPPEAAVWRKALEAASVKDAQTYRTALVAEIRTLVCSSGDDAAYILRGLLYGSLQFGIIRLQAVGPEAPELVDSIMSKDCPVSVALTAADRASLLRIKQSAPDASKPAQ